jgi:hypothetical protein
VDVWKTGPNPDDDPESSLSLAQAKYAEQAETERFMEIMKWQEPRAFA